MNKGFLSENGKSHPKFCGLNLLYKEFYCQTEHIKKKKKYIDPLYLYKTAIIVQVKKKDGWELKIEDSRKHHWIFPYMHCHQDIKFLTNKKKNPEITNYYQAI